MSDANKTFSKTNSENDTEIPKFQFGTSISILKHQNKLLENHLNQLDDIKSRLESAIKNDPK